MTPQGAANSFYPNGKLLGSNYIFLNPSEPWSPTKHWHGIEVHNALGRPVIYHEGQYYLQPSYYKTP